MAIPYPSSVSPDTVVEFLPYEPLQVNSVPEGLVAKQVACGSGHRLALLEDGSVVGWGANEYGQCNPPPGLVATQIAAKTYCSFIIWEDGTAVEWGWGKTIPSDLVATQIASRSWGVTLVLKPDGSTAYYGTNCPQTYPGDDVVQIDNQGNGGILLLDNKEVVCTTRYDIGYAIDPWFVPGLKATQVAIGGGFALAIGSFEDGRSRRRKRAAWLNMERPLFL